MTSSSEVSISALRQAFTGLCHFTGAIVSYHPFSPDTKLLKFQLVAPGSASPSSAARIDVQLKGAWASEVQFAVGLTLTLSSKHGEIQLVGQKSLRTIVYSTGLCGTRNDTSPVTKFNFSAGKKKQPPKSKTVVSGGPTSATALVPSMKRPLAAAAPVETSVKRSKSTAALSGIVPVAATTTKPTMQKSGGRAQKTSFWPRDMGTDTFSDSFVAMDQYTLWHKANPQHYFDAMGVGSKLQGLPKTATRTDLDVCLALCDPSDPYSQTRHELFARPDSPHFLPVIEAGDVVLLRKVKYTVNRQAVTGHKSIFQFKIFKASELAKPTSTFPPSLPASPAEARYGPTEIAYARFLYNWHRTLPPDNKSNISRPLVVPTVYRKARGGRKLITVSQVEKRVFCNLVVQVLSIWADTSEKRIELFVTDYTSHPDLYDHADSESRTSGPYGRRRLQVTMWDSVGEDYKKWEKNKILYLENVQFRPNAMGGIEAAMHANNEWEGKIRVALIGKDFGRKLGAGVEEKTRRLGARVSAYWLAIDGGALDADFDDNYQEPQMDVEVAPAPAPVAAPANAAASRALSSPSTSSIKTEVQNVVLAPVPIASPVLLRSKNAGVTFSLTSLTYTPLADILRGPQTLDTTYRSRGRIVATFKPDLADWVRCDCPECLSPVPSGAISCLQHGKAVFSWRFGVAIEETPNETNDGNRISMRVLVDQLDSSLVLPKIPPTQQIRGGEPELQALRKRFERVLKRSKAGDICGEYFDFGVVRRVEKGKVRYRFSGTSFGG